MFSAVVIEFLFFLYSTLCYALIISHQDEKKNEKRKEMRVSSRRQDEIFLGFFFYFIFPFCSLTSFFQLEKYFFCVCFLYEENRAWRKEKMLRIDLTFHFVLIVSRFFFSTSSLGCKPLFWKEKSEWIFFSLFSWFCYRRPLPLFLMYIFFASTSQKINRKKEESFLKYVPLGALYF